MDVIVLAGGRGRRMGGVDKAGVLLDGRRLLDHLIEGLPGSASVIVVTPRDLPLPPGVRRMSEDPPFGGPVAGIAAALPGLRAELTAVLAVDAPDSPALLSPLRTALRQNPDAGVAVVRAADGVLQPLCALWRREALVEAVAALGGTRDVAAKKLIACARAVEVPGGGLDTDYDTLEELATRGDVT